MRCRTAVVVAVLTMSILSCGGDAETTGESEGVADVADGGDSAEFCAALARLDALELQSDAGPFIDGMRELDDAAPAEIEDATDQLVSFLEASLAIGELEGDERDAAIDELAEDESDFDQAVADLEAYATDACPELSDALFGPDPE